MLGLGCMRVRDPAVVRAALDAGVTLLDTADVYDTEDIVASAVAGRRPGVTVVTKGGLVRDGARFVADGRARHLEEAAAASRARLGAIDLYLLHAVDPRVPLATSVRALARLRDDGVVARIGLCNVTRTQLDEAAAITELACVQVELSPRDVTAVRGGVVSWCAERGVLLLAHRPLGGKERVRQLLRDPDLVAIAARVGATAAEVALAWVRGLGAVPLPGASTVEHAVSAARVVALPEEDRERLDARYLAHVPRTTVGGTGPRPCVHLVMGIPGAGKSTLVAPRVEAGAVRLNRDERGGKLDTLARALDEALAGGASEVVLDNTYPTRSSRAPVIAAARRHGARVRCTWLDTSIEDAQVNAAIRVLERHGRLLEPAELRAAKEPGPKAQFDWRRQLEPPAADEGLDEIERVPFVRRSLPGAHRALVVELSGIPPGAADAIHRWRDAGWLVLGTGWQQVPDTFDLDVAVCPHPAGPPVCWCRKPMPGLGLVLARRHDVDLARSVHVGPGAADRGFAARLGLRYVDTASWLVMSPP